MSSRAEESQARQSPPLWRLPCRLNGLTEPAWLSIDRLHLTVEQMTDEQHGLEINIHLPQRCSADCEIQA